MAPGSDNSIADVAKNLPKMTKGDSKATGSPKIPAGSVVAKDGTIVTLGEKAGSNINLSSRDKGKG